MIHAVTRDPADAVAVDKQSLCPEGLRHANVDPCAACRDSDDGDPAQRDPTLRQSAAYCEGGGMLRSDRASLPSMWMTVVLGLGPLNRIIRFIEWNHLVY